MKSHGRKISHPTQHSMTPDLHRRYQRIWPDGNMCNVSGRLT